MHHQEDAEILVGEELPHEIKVQESIEGKPTNVTTTNYKDIGMKLKVKPIVAPDHKAVFLDIFVENSDVVAPKAVLQSSADSSRGNYNYTVRTSRSRNRVLLNSGQTTLIGGLMMTVKENSKTGVPFLKDIPVLGFFFGGSRKRFVDKQLLIFITPTLI